ncbi:hypothetical protein AJ80_09010 [Polytolypa hystricis UAMH7299]|uniref:Zn(2)-C6 fungal-type domain-containing protein n=1 Tax=Polytolypa hystricis (strain UAMH7299) TaxID=1447883 RepID=A0A2B7WXU2_POLH7|nr:hypothetical protein AJ80_09010 [Polytolypa hystricis UAMH7299]
MDKENTRSSSPMSKTCQSCANSKVRCVRTAGQQPCNRCRRLGKECVYRQTRRRFYGFQKDLRIEALELKVNELMGTIVASSLTDTDVGASETRGNTLGGSEPDARSVVDEDVIDRGLLTIEIAEIFFGTFKTAMTEYFPFVVIPPQVTAEQLRREKPFLFLAVLASSSFTDMPL